MSKIGFVASAFDLMHPGHMLMLEECKSQCDYLIAGLHIRPEHKTNTIQSAFERYILLKGCKYVNEIVPYETEKDLELLLSSLKINIRFLGSDYAASDFRSPKIITGLNICKQRNIDFYYCKREHSFSSTDLKKRCYDSLSNTSKS